MKLRVEFKPEAVHDLEDLDRAVSQRVLNKIHWLAQNFTQIVPERLTGELGAFYKLRVGDWRVIYLFDSEAITVHMIGHRREIYKF